MLEQYKWFSLDETNQWNHDFNEALAKGNKETILQLLHNGGELYLDEYSIYHAFTRLSHRSTNAQRGNGVFMHLKAGDRRLFKRDLQFHLRRPPQPRISSTVLPRSLATSSALRSCLRPSSVALTMLILLLVP